MEPRAVKYLVLVLLILLPAIAHASGPDVDAQESTVSTEDLQQAMAEAQKEYEEAVARSASPSPVKHQDIGKLIAGLVKNRSKEERSVVEELAREVDALRNRLVIERATHFATQAPRNVKLNGATTVFHYRQDAIYEVSSAVDYVTDIRLKPGEQLTTPPTAGDTVRWNIGVMESGSGKSLVTHIILEPTEPNIDTNLVITTDQRIYHLAIKSSLTHMPAVSWNYPEDNEERMRQAMQRRRLTEPTIRPEELRFSYIISGPDLSWKPLRVFDDGVKTFLQMPKKWKTGDAPALFLIEEGEEPLLVNYRIEGDFYIVDRLFEKAQLVVGKNRRVEIELDDGPNFFERLFGL